MILEIPSLGEPQTLSIDSKVRASDCALKGLNLNRSSIKRTPADHKSNLVSYIYPLNSLITNQGKLQGPYN
jgi:hypothetical protein